MVRRGFIQAISMTAVLLCLAGPGAAANNETIDTVDAYVAENGVTVNVFCHNEDGILEYFNLIVFDDSRLEYQSIDADRGALWYGYYPTHVDGNRIYVHGVAGGLGCIDPDWTVPGSPLYHVVFDVKPGVEAGLADLNFSSEVVWDGHWNDCSGYQVTPDPEYYSGGVNVLGHAGHVTVGSDSTSPGGQAIVDVYMHNDLDVFEYWNQILFDDGIAEVDSIVAARGALHYGFYPTHVSGDTIYVHGWTGDSGDCFTADHTYPGTPLYRIHLTLREWAPSGYTMPLPFLTGDPVWNHWVGCDLCTTDSFTGTDGSVFVGAESGLEEGDPAGVVVRLARPSPNPTTGAVSVSYYLPELGRVAVAVYDVAGRRVTTLAAGSSDAGWHEVLWDGTDAGGDPAAGGVYFCRLETEGAVLSRKLVVVR
jgi:hypothetical protein